MRCETARLACVEDDPPGIRGKRQLQTGAWQALGEQRPWGQPCSGPHCPRKKLFQLCSASTRGVVGCSHQPGASPWTRRVGQHCADFPACALISRPGFVKFGGFLSFSRKDHPCSSPGPRPPASCKQVSPPVPSYPVCICLFQGLLSVLVPPRSDMACKTTHLGHPSFIFYFFSSFSYGDFRLCDAGPESCTSEPLQSSGVCVPSWI